VRDTLSRQGIPAGEQTLTYQVDMRYHGQGFEITIGVDPALFSDGRMGLDSLAAAFDAEHERLFSFLLEHNDHEIVNVRVSASGPRPRIAATELAAGGEVDPVGARRATTTVWADGAEREAGVYERTELRAGDVVNGPAIVAEMDATTLVLPGHAATVHPSGSLLIRPTEA
jgi:N-methylhydantoinase A